MSAYGRFRSLGVWFAGILLVLLIPSGVLAKGGGGPRLGARAVLALHHRSGKVLYARNPQAVRAIASLSKVAAALVVRRRDLELEAGTTISRADHRVGLGGARTRLQLRWTYRNRDLLHAALMASDNRAVSALGRSVGLDARGLVGAMNALARRLGLRKTRFADPVGINHDNRSTAWEVAQLMRLAGKDELLSDVMSTRSHRVRPLRGSLSIRYGNTNRLLGRIEGVHFIASKTGYNRRARYCFAATVDVRGLGRTTIVLLGSRSKGGRMADARRLLVWLKRQGRQVLSRRRRTARRSEG